MQIIRIISPWIFLLTFTCSIACGQAAPLSVEVFAEGGGSFLSKGSLGGACSLGGCIFFPIGFSNGGRLFTGARFGVTRHDGIEVSYSYSPNSFALAGQSNRLDVLSFNYVRYLGIRARVQPFATVGIGANRLSGLASLGYPSDNGFHFAWNYGGGADILLQGRLALRLELRDYVGGQPSFLTGTSHNIVPSAGIVFRFK